MLKAYIFFIVVLLFPAFSVTAQSEAPIPQYDPTTVHTFRGKVVSVQKFSFVTRPVPYLQFIFHTGGGEYTVEVAPEWVLEVGGILIVPGEELEVTGSLIDRGKRKILIASSIKKNNSEIRLRSDEGKPLWGGQRNLSY